MRLFQSGLKLHNRSFKNAQAAGARIEFFTSFKKRLVSHTDSQERSSFCNPFFDRAIQFLPLHRVHTIIESTDARQHDTASALQTAGGPGAYDLGSAKAKRFFHRADVAGVVVE